MSGAGQTRRRSPLAVSMGDPAGIGIEITLKAWARRTEERLPPIVLFADPDEVGLVSGRLSLATPRRDIESLSEAAELCDRGLLPIKPVYIRTNPQPGIPNPLNAPGVIASIEEAAAAVARGEAAALVTNPISKHALAQVGFPYPGHTEFLAAIAERHFGKSYRPVMMLASPELRVVPLTVHTALVNVPKMITRAAIFETVRITYAALKIDFGIDAPRIAVTGLNPHAGEEGTMGREEIDTIAPAIADLRSEGLSVTGPHPADTLFHAAARRTYDAVVAMYHDQALIPLKTLAFDEGVNVTLGLPFVRTSPDHGTAFDIAGEGRASPASLIAALKLAASIAAARAASSA